MQEVQTVVKTDIEQGDVTPAVKTDADLGTEAANDLLHWTLGRLRELGMNQGDLGNERGNLLEVSKRRYVHLKKGLKGSKLHIQHHDAFVHLKLTPTRVLVEIGHVNGKKLDRVSKIRLISNFTQTPAVREMVKRLYNGTDVKLNFGKE